MKIERRCVPITELRTIRAEGESPKIQGYAAVFNSLSEDLGGFREKISPGAFKAAVAGSDTRALFNHNSDYVLGRKSAGTLNVKEDERGLWFENTPPDTQWARDMLVSIDRGDITQMSFGFRMAEGGDTWAETDVGPERTLLNIAELPDVSPVTYPAYTDTKVALRSMTEWRNLENKEEPNPDDATVKPDQDAESETANRNALQRQRALNIKIKMNLTGV